MHQFHHDRLTLAYRDAGSGPAIVMLHNGGTSSVIWRNQIADLAPSHRVIAIDLPGFGESPLPDPPARLDDMVEAIAALITAEDLAPVTLLGNCMGSNISVNLGREHPELISGIIAVNPLTAESFSGGGLGFTHTMKRLASATTRAVRGISRRIKIPKFAGSPTLRFQLGPKGIAKNLHHDPDLLSCQFRADQMPALVDVLDDMDAYGAIDADATDTTADTTAIPTVIVWGERNRVLSRSRAAHLDEALHAERVEVIEGCGHLPMLEDPEAVTSIVRDFIDHPVSVA